MWNLMMNKNVTLVFDAEKLAQLRVLAAKERTTVNALLRKHVDELLDIDGRRQKARDWMVAKARENLANDAERALARGHGEAVSEETWRWNREDTYSGPRFDWPRKS
jgi:hypothetical protein